MVSTLITPSDLIQPGMSTGLVPRDYKALPVGYLPCAAPFDLPLMTDDEIEACILRKNIEQSWLDDVRKRGKFSQIMPSTDQNGKGYCWAHSSTSAALLIRALNNQPYADLSAYAVACVIKSFRDQGGWGSESVEFIAERGIPTSEFWAQKSMSRSNDNEKTWENAKQYRITEWMDLEPRNARQYATCLCNDIPVVSDYNWWGHSVCSCRLISWGPNGRNLRSRIWNSWGDSWKDQGMGDLDGKQALPDGQIAPRVLTAAA